VKISVCQSLVENCNQKIKKTIDNVVKVDKQCPRENIKYQMILIAAHIATTDPIYSTKPSPRMSIPPPK